MNGHARSQLAASNAGFGLAAAITVLFNTILACVKDAYRPLLNVMNAIAYHNWITQGIADIILFFALGFLFSKTGVAARIGSQCLTSFLIVAVIVAGAGLFVWYIVF